MPQSTTIRGLIILGVFLLFGYFMVPTIQYNTMSLEEQEALRLEDPQRHKELLKNSIKLGLDLQGGMHLVLEIDLKELLAKLARNKDERFNKALEAAAAEAEEGAGIVSLLDEKLREMGGDITLYYSTRDMRTRDEVLEFLESQASESVDRSLEVLRNRVDEFGVSEPIIQKQGGNRIIVELAGVTDRQQAIELVGKTAKLQFTMLKDMEVAQRIATRVNEYLSGTAAADSGDAVAEGKKDAGPDKSPTDSSVVSAEELFGTADSAGRDSAGLAGDERESEDLFVVLPQAIFVRESDIPRFNEVMQDPVVQQIITQEAASANMYLESLDIARAGEGGEERFIQAYLVNGTPALTGETIIDAQWSLGRADDPTNFGKFETNITFNDEGTRAFAAVTGANTGKRLAIVLDDRVRSAPNIREKIRNGRARITGLESSDEARVLSSVLKAGALPTPLKIIEERTVGPSLGKDSIRQGTYSTIMGLILVAIFMIIYYKFSGVVANVALILNIFILLGFMSSLHATLTLPGIAGIILTIGMAVDANVLIFERIREELDRGKSNWAAIDTGYGRAFVTIMDANVTTFIAAVVLYNFGSGPVRGFATTLMIGIGASMFTAIFVTRTLFDFLLSRKIIKQLSI